MALKIAYICLCHTDPDFIARVAKTLRYETDGFFIHVDNKIEITPFLEKCGGLDNVHFVEDRIDNYWGGYNSIIATMKTFKLALSTDNYDRFVLLQGQDYPLYSSKEIHDFFELHREIEFCKAKNISVTTIKNDYMRCCGLWLMDMKLSFPQRYIRALFHRFNHLGIKYRRATFNNKGSKWYIYHGWAQFALTADCIKHILDVYENNKAFNRYMKRRFPPDELYIQTVVHNSLFKDRVPNDTVVRRSGEKTLLNLTYFEYPASGVIVFTEKEDYRWLKGTGCLFVRKVNSTSTNLLDEIDKHILAD